MKKVCVMIVVIKKRCKECNIMKNCNTFYSYKNGKTYSSCRVCFNKKVRCEFCNKDLNKSYLRSHIKKQHLYQHYNRDSSRTNINTGGDLLPTQGFSRQLRDSYHTHNNNINDNNNNNNAEANAEAIAKAIANDDNAEANAGANANSGVNETNRTLIVGPSFCGKTHLLLNKLRLIRLEDPEKQIRIITRSPEQYEDVGSKLKLDLELGDIEVEGNVGDLEEYRGCCVVFDDMLDSNQKLIDPFFTRGRHKSCDVYYSCQSYFFMHQKRQLGTIRIQ